MQKGKPDCNLIPISQNRLGYRKITNRGENEKIQVPVKATEVAQTAQIT